MTIKSDAQNISCPNCGYYCLGKGGIGCIDKPHLTEMEQKSTNMIRYGISYREDWFDGIESEEHIDMIANLLIETTKDDEIPMPRKGWTHVGSRSHHMSYLHTFFWEEG